MEQPIKAMLIDTSLEFCTLISQKMQNSSQIDLVTTVSDLSRVRSEFLRHNPQALLVDIAVFEQSGIEFLKILMEQKMILVLILGNNSSRTAEMQRRGAISLIIKPRLGESSERWQMFTDDMTDILMRNISPPDNKSAIAPGTVLNNNQEVLQNEIKPKVVPPLPRKTITKRPTLKLIAIGASTGGTEATSSILSRLSPKLPGIVVVQHMPPEFIEMYAKRLNEESELRVVVAQSGMTVESGHVYVARGDCHLRVLRRGTDLVLSCSGTDKVSGHCPSVNVLFTSVAQNVGAEAIGIILTGMGADGALGLLEMKKNGAYTIGQDESSCVVYGMPHEAFQIGAVTTQISLDKIPDMINGKAALHNTSII